MSDSTRAKLQEAYHLIKIKDFVAARPLLIDILREDKNNVDAWWLAVYAAETDKDKRIALHKVLTLKPDHTAAQEMLKRLNTQTDIPAQTGPLVSPVRKLAKKKRASSVTRIMLLVGFIGIGFTVLAIYDSITGKNILGPLQKLLGIEEEVYGWVEADNVGIADEGEERIPIVSEVKAEYNKIQSGTLFKGEAHSYRIVAIPNDTILITIVFSQDLIGFDEQDLVDALSNFPNIDPNNRPIPPVPLMELWNSNNRVIEYGRIGDLPGTQMIEYNPVKHEALTLVITGRDGAPTGNYFLQITSMSGIGDMMLEYGSP